MSKSFSDVSSVRQDRVLEDFYDQLTKLDLSEETKRDLLEGWQQVQDTADEVVSQAYEEGYDAGKESVDVSEESAK